MLVVRLQFRFRHFGNPQMLTHAFQAGSRRVVRHFSCIQIINPFLQRSFCDLVKAIDLQDVVFRIKVAYGIHLEFLTLERRQLQYVAGMYSSEFRFTVIHIVFPCSQWKIYDIYAVNLTHILVSLATVDIFRHKL